VDHCFVIGVIGLSGSGKSTLAKDLYKRFDDSSAVLCGDNYYKDFTDEDVGSDGLNFDHPNRYDFELLLHDIEQLSKGRRVYTPVYDFFHHKRTETRILIRPKPVLIVEGIFLLHSAKIMETMNLSIFLDVDSSVCLDRRVMRDCKERGRDARETRHQFLSEVVPMYQKFCYPYRESTDLVLKDRVTDADIRVIYQRYHDFKLQP